MKHQRAKEAVAAIKEAIGVRAQITELYRSYRNLSNLACEAAQLNHNDLKRAVDALYYLGGGWPKPSSKGRMEALLENFVGMYRILHFAGYGSIVEEHLAKFGVTVSLDPQFRVENRELEHNEREYLKKNYGSKIFSERDLKDVRDLVDAVIMECQGLQGEICELADEIKEDLRPTAQRLLEIEDAEYDRLFALTRLGMSESPKADDQALSKRHKIHTSLSGMNAGMAHIKDK